jgi:ABC-type branched-subunit amino acid transport system permease subunit
MEQSANPSLIRASLARRYWPLLALCVAVTAIVAIASFGSAQLQVTITEMLIRLIAVVGTYVFIGNSGILSFGHIGFMCIGAYAAAWATVDPNWKQMMLTGLPDFLQANQYGFIPAVAGGGLLAALVALRLGSAIMRLSGIAGSLRLSHSLQSSTASAPTGNRSPRRRVRSSVCRLWSGRGSPGFSRSEH